MIRLLKRSSGGLNNPQDAELMRIVKRMPEKGKTYMRGRHWTSGYEVCGVITAGDRIVEMNNEATGPGKFAFPAMAVVALYEAAGTSEQAKAIWHSHPNGNDELSEADKAAHPAFVPFAVIVNPKDGIVSWWEMH
jgi:proteasome lid subunit RPN8/RPN11